MRAILNSILQFIEMTTLTDEEYAEIELDEDASETEQFNALKGVLASRDAVNNDYRRLTSYFKAKGMVFSTDAEQPIIKTNIFVGSVLE